MKFYMKNLKVIVSAFIILLWSFTFAKVDITGKAVKEYTVGGFGFFPVLSVVFLLVSFVLVWLYLKNEDEYTTH